MSQFKPPVNFFVEIWRKGHQTSLGSKGFLRRFTHSKGRLRDAICGQIFLTATKVEGDKS